MRMKTSLLGGAALAAVAACALTTPVLAQDTGIAWKGSPQFTNDDVQFKVRGRILLDAVFEDVDRETGVDQEFRALRGRQVFLGVEGKLNNYIAYKAEGGAVNGGAWSWDDVVIEFKPNEMTSLMVGNIKAAGLENLTSTRFTTFMDRGPYGEIGPDSYTVSGVAKFNGLNWTLTGAVQGDSLNSADVTTGEERLGFTGRGSYAPILTDTTKVHVGGFVRQRDHGDEAGFSYQTRPNTAFGSRYVNTGAIGKSDFTWGLEGAVIFNQFSLQAEYADISVDRLTSATIVGSDPDIQVGYVFASFWPTGEQRNYDAAKGEFARPKILNPITAGGFGGVELAVRYDFADLTDAYATAGNAATRTLSQDAGEYTAWTVGVNYYPTGYVRLQANYTASKNDNPVTGRDVDANVFQLRAQMDF